MSLLKLNSLHLHLLHGRKQWLALGSLAITRRVSAALLATAMAVYIGRQASPFAVSLALAVFQFGLLVFAPIWGTITDITGERRSILILTTASLTVAICPLIITQTVWAQLTVRFIYAIFVAGTISTTLTIVSEHGDTVRRGRSIGIYQSAGSIGSVGGRVLAGIFLGLVVASQMYLLTTVISGIAALAAVFVYDPTSNPETSLHIDDLLREVRYRLIPAVDEREHLMQNGASWLYVAIILRNMTQKGVGSVLPIFLLSSIGVDEFTMGLLLSISPTLRTAFMYIFGQISDAIGRKPLITIGLAGAGFQSIVIATALFPSDIGVRIAIVAVGFIIHAVTFSALAIGTIAFLGDIAPINRESELMGLRTTTRGIGGVVGPLLVGGIATVWSYPAAFVVMSLLAFVAVGIVVETLIESHPTEIDNLHEAFSYK